MSVEPSVLPWYLPVVYKTLTGKIGQQVLPASVIEQGIKQIAPTVEKLWEHGVRVYGSEFGLRKLYKEASSFIVDETVLASAPQAALYWQMLRFIDRPCATMIDQIYYHAILADAIYFDKTIDMLEKEWASGSQKWLQMLAYSEQSALGRPRYAYFVDHHTRSMLIIVRGTAPISDVMTDAELRTISEEEADQGRGIVLRVHQEDGDGSINSQTIDYMRRKKEYVMHFGFINSAINILRDECIGFENQFENCRKALNLGEDDILPIVVTGHSLGASTASCITYILNRNGYEARGVVFAPAPCFSQSMIVDDVGGCRTKILSVVNRFDVVPHADAGVTERSAVIWASSLPQGRPKYNELIEAEEQMRVRHATEFATSLAQVIDDRTAQRFAREMPGESHESVLFLRTQLYNTLQKIAYEERYVTSHLVAQVVPGTIYWLHEINEGNRTVVGIYHVKDRRFFTLLKPAGGVTIDTPVARIVNNPATDHFMDWYISTLRCIRSKIE